MSNDPTLAAMIEAATDAGASGALVATLATDAPGDVRHLSRRQVARAMRHGTPDMPGGWGHFMTHLWYGSVEAAWRTADADNARIMTAAGLPERHALRPEPEPA